MPSKKDFVQPIGRFDYCQDMLQESHFIESSPWKRRLNVPVEHQSSNESKEFESFCKV